MQRALAPVGATITPSAMVDVPGQVSQREIDILIESGVGPYRITIAVEAKDEGRKMDQPHFEQLLAKYQSEGSIKVNKLVVVTHHGFYEPVIERAKLLGDQVELLTYKEATSTDWGKLPPGVIRFTLPPHLCSFTFSPSIEGIDAARLWKGAKIICSHGTDFGTPEAYSLRVFQTKVLADRPQLLEELSRQALSEPQGQAFANITFSMDHHVLAIDDTTFPLSQIGFSVHVVDGKSSMGYHVCEITAASGLKTTVPMAQAIVAGKKLQFVFPDGLQSSQIVLRIDDADPTGKPTEG